MLHPGEVLPGGQGSPVAPFANVTGDAPFRSPRYLIPKDRDVSLLIRNAALGQQRDPVALLQDQASNWCPNPVQV